jgi:hypothetical protein
MVKPVGTKTKRRLYREARAAMQKHGPILDKVIENGGGLTSLDYISESLVCMGEALKFFTEYARVAKDPETKRERYHDVLNAASMLAPFRYPKYATLKVANDAGSEVLVGDDKDSATLAAELMEQIRATGMLPRQMIDVNAAASRGLI